jgi:hypothetical protein
MAFSPLKIFTVPLIIRFLILTFYYQLFNPRNPDGPQLFTHVSHVFR